MADQMDTKTRHDHANALRTIAGAFRGIAEIADGAAETFLGDNDDAACMAELEKLKQHSEAVAAAMTGRPTE